MYSKYLNYWRDLAAVLSQNPAALGKTFDRFVSVDPEASAPARKEAQAPWQRMAGQALDFLSTASLFKVWLHYRAQISENEDLAAQLRRNVLLRVVIGSVRRNPWMQEAIASVQASKKIYLSRAARAKALLKPLPLDVLETAFPFADQAETAMHIRNAEKFRRDPAYLYGLFTDVVGQAKRYPGIGAWAIPKDQPDDYWKEKPEGAADLYFSEKMLAWEKTAKGLLCRLSLPELQAAWEAYENTDCHQPGINEHNVFFVQRTIEVFAGYHRAIAPYTIMRTGMDGYYCDSDLNHLVRDVWSVEMFPESLDVAVKAEAQKPGLRHPPRTRFRSHVLKQA